MSKYEIVRSLKVEIKKLNRIIDQKILNGLPYSAEARRHKFLMSQLRRISPSPSWLSRSLSFATFFLL